MFSAYPTSRRLTKYRIKRSRKSGIKGKNQIFRPLFRIGSLLKENHISVKKGIIVTHQHKEIHAKLAEIHFFLSEASKNLFVPWHAVIFVHFSTALNWTLDLKLVQGKLFRSPTWMTLHLTDYTLDSKQLPKTGP